MSVTVFLVSQIMNLIEAIGKLASTDGVQHKIINSGTGTVFFTDILFNGEWTIEICWRKEYQSSGCKVPYRFLGAVVNDFDVVELKTCKAVVSCLESKFTLSK